MLDIVILCGGKGTRLNTVVNDRQKCVADIEGKPFLHYLISYWKTKGFRRFILCTGHLSETVENLTASIDGVEILLSQEDTPLGTGGAIYKAANLVNGSRFAAMNGDSFCPVDLPEMLEAHKRYKDASLTIALTKIEDTNDYGNVILDSENRIIKFAEKEKTDNAFINAGIYLIEKTSLSAWPPAGEKFSLEKDVFTSLAGKGLYGYCSSQPLLDIGTPERYKKASVVLMNLIDH